MKPILNPILINFGKQSTAESENDNVLALVRFAVCLMQTLKQINVQAFQDFKLRIGIAVGPVIAGIVGATKPQYDIWVCII